MVLRKEQKKEANVKNVIRAPSVSFSTMSHIVPDVVAKHMAPQHLLENFEISQLIHSAPHPNLHFIWDYRKKEN